MGSGHQAQQGVTREALALEISGDGVWELPELTADEPLRDDAPAYYAPRFCEMLGHAEPELPPVAGSWAAAAPASVSAPPAIHLSASTMAPCGHSRVPEQAPPGV